MFHALLSQVGRRQTGLPSGETGLELRRNPPTCKEIAEPTIGNVGHYHETYEKTDGEWRIKTLRLTRLRMDMTAPPPA